LLPWLKTPNIKPPPGVAELNYVANRHNTLFLSLIAAG